MFHPIIFHIHILISFIWPLSDYPERLQKFWALPTFSLPTIMKKVALPHGYFPAALVNITSGFL